mgnify:CR=1 FL=1
MIAAFRLCKTKHLASAFSGEGARLNGGRWNSPGLAVVYTSSSLSLATLEVLVHLEDPAVFDRVFSWVPVAIPPDTVARLDPLALARGWHQHETNASSRNMGDMWLRSRRSAAYAVPSAVTPGEWNYLLNPAHPRFNEIEIGEARRFEPDSRLVHG